MPFALAGHGVAMLSSVLNSDRAVQINIEIIKTFVRLKKLLAPHGDLKKKIDAMVEKYHEQFRVVFEAIKQLLEKEEKPRRTIGF